MKVLGISRGGTGKISTLQRQEPVFSQTSKNSRICKKIKDKNKLADY
jgi:hypothetical protein